MTNFDAENTFKTSSFGFRGAIALVNVFALVKFSKFYHAPHCEIWSQALYIPLKKLIEIVPHGKTTESFGIPRQNID